MNRRRFLFLCGAATPGIWLAGSGLIRLPGRMVVALSGRCSFCSKAGTEVFGLAGVVGRPDRVCDECVGLCLEVLHDEAVSPRPEPRTPPSSPPAPSPEEVEDILRRIASEYRGIDIDAIRSSLQTRREQPDVLACSFCESTSKEVAKLIAGPTVRICDVCVADAATLLAPHGWRA